MIIAGSASWPTGALVVIMGVNFSTWVAPSVRLADGRVVPSDDPEWLAECEVRRIFELGSLNARIEELDRLEKKRGKAARQDLERRILALWETERSKSGY